jgi:hypothetical protein
LPVYSQSNKAWVTVQLFLHWFHDCFLLEVEKCLALLRMGWNPRYSLSTMRQVTRTVCSLAVVT